MKNQTKRNIWRMTKKKRSSWICMMKREKTRSWSPTNILYKTVMMKI